MVAAVPTIKAPATGGAEILSLIKPPRDESAKTITTVITDDESSDDETSTSSSERHKKMPRRVSLEEQNNEIFEIPRINERYKKRCWLTREELEHNFMMNRVRGLVEAKLKKLLAKNDDYFEITAKENSRDHSETEADRDDLLDGLLGNNNNKEPTTTKPRPNNEERVVKRGMVPATRRDRILQHLLDAIMERRKEEIHSFLTSKCSISFSRQPNTKTNYQ